MTRSLGAADVGELAAGARLLAAGGGGDVEVGELILARMLAGEGAPAVRLCAAADLPEEALVVHVGLVGSPDVLAEQLLDARDLVAAVRAIEGRVGAAVAAVSTFEIGGLNGLVGPISAVELDVPLIDGDLMGRAYPRITQSTLALHGHPPGPVALVSSRGELAVYEATEPVRLEQLALSGTMAMGGLACAAMFPVAAGDLVSLGIPGSVTAARRLGRRYLGLGGRTRDTPAETAAALGGHAVAEARIDDILHPLGGHAGSATLSGTRDGAIIRLDFRDECILVAVDGEAVAAAPDIIVAMDHLTAQPVRCDDLRVGQTLLLIVLPALYQWPAEHLHAVGPAAFGIDLEAS